MDTKSFVVGKKIHLKGTNQCGILKIVLLRHLLVLVTSPGSSQEKLEKWPMQLCEKKLRKTIDRQAEGHVEFRKL